MTKEQLTEFMQMIGCKVINKLEDALTSRIQEATKSRGNRDHLTLTIAKIADDDCNCFYQNKENKKYTQTALFHKGCKVALLKV